MITEGWMDNITIKIIDIVIIIFFVLVGVVLNYEHNKMILKKKENG